MIVQQSLSLDRPIPASACCVRMDRLGTASEGELTCDELCLLDAAADVARGASSQHRAGVPVGAAWPAQQRVSASEAQLHTFQSKHVHLE